MIVGNQLNIIQKVIRDKYGLYVSSDEIREARARGKNIFDIECLKRIRNDRDAPRYKDRRHISGDKEEEL